MQKIDTPVKEDYIKKHLRLIKAELKYKNERLAAYHKQVRNED